VETAPIAADSGSCASELSRWRRRLVEQWRTTPLEPDQLKPGWERLETIRFHQLGHSSSITPDL